MAFLGVWLIVGTICGIIAIAVSRDRDSKWFLAGFLLGPIGIVVALLAPRGGSRRHQGCVRSHVRDARHSKTSQLTTRRTNAGSASWCHLHPDQSDSTLDGTTVSL